MKKKMTASVPVIIFLGILICLMGCGKREEAAEYNSIITETEQLPDMREGVNISDMLEYVYLGSQFYQGDRVQLWGERKTEGGSVYLHRENGDRELLIENVHGYFMGNGKWWLDGEGRCYILRSWELIRPDGNGGLKPDAEFKNYEGVVFRHEMDQNKLLMDICQLEDGRIIVLIDDNFSRVLAEVDPDSGRMKELQSIYDTDFWGVLIAPKGEEVALLGYGGVKDWNLESGKTNSLISFTGTSYILKDDESGKREKEDFRMLEDGRAELLWSDGSVEFLSQEQIEDERESVVICAGIADPWLKEQIVKFNQENKEYYIVIEENTGDDLQSFLERTDMELAAGGGADVICSSVVNDIYSLLEKGAFEELTPWMEDAGIREEDYFPAAFSGWKKDGKIYGIGCRADIRSLWMNPEIVGEEGVSGVEELVNCMLAYEGDAIFQKHVSSVGVMRQLLMNSESLCGMVNFENGTCDFSGELFGKLLEAAKRYGYDKRKEADTVVAGGFDYCNFYSFFDRSYLTQMGRVLTGYLFDDGGYACMDSYNMLAINANSTKKEGAWDFIRFMLGEEVQMDFDVETAKYSYDYFPTSRKAFEELCGRCAETIPEGIMPVRVYGTEEIEIIITGLTEERKAELSAALENARTKPLKTEAVIQIITEEARAYFTDDKTIDEVRTLVQNRVQLYLNERE